MPREEQGPPEMALDDDSDSESGSNSSSSSGEESSTSNQVKVKVEENAEEPNKKRKRGGDYSDDESDDESDSDEKDSDDEEKSEDAKDDDTPIVSITKAQKDPIYIHPRAESKAGFKHRSCYLCPMAVLKTERSITVHLEGNVSCQLQI